MILARISFKSFLISILLWQHDMSETRKTILNSQSKDIVYNVSKYFEQQASVPSTMPVNAYIQKTVDTTSISERSIRRIRKEKSDTGVLQSPPKTRNREPLKPVDDFDRCAIRNKIHEFYTVRRQLPTLEKLHKSLKDDIKFDGSVSLLRNIVKELGFKWKRSQGRRKVIIERYDIVDLRCLYLKIIREYHEKNMSIVYIDETWIATSYTAEYCWQSKDERGALLPISRGQRLIVVHGGGCRCQTTNSPIRAWNINESSPFSRKKFLSLCSIVKTTEWNGLIKIDN